MIQHLFLLFFENMKGPWKVDFYYIPIIINAQTYDWVRIEQLTYFYNAPSWLIVVHNLQVLQIQWTFLR